MANTTIVLKKSATSGNTPSSLANGELAINFADGKLFYRAANGTIQAISGAGGGGSTNSFATVNANSSLILATSSTDTLSIAPGNGISISANTTSKTITITSTANADVFSSNTVNTLSLLANTANISTLNVVNHVVTGNANIASLSVTNIYANNYYYANGTPFSGGGGGGGGGGNVSASGWTANSVITANSTGYLSSPANLQFFTSNNTLVVTGNVVGGGVRTTSAATPPASPTAGDLWYNTSTDVMYRYTFDGTNYYWIDNVSSATASNGSLLQANVTYTGVTSNIVNTTAIYANTYYFANGAPLTTGTKSTSSATPPSSPAVGDIWYKTTTDIEYRYTYDGTSYYWVDVIGSTVSVSNTSLNVTYNTANISTLNVTTATVGSLTATNETVTSSLTTTTLNVTTGNVAGYSIGYLTVPQNTQTANYTLSFSDSGKHIFMANGTANLTITIPSNASVPFPLGTAITFVNYSQNNYMSINITSDVMNYSNTAGTTGTRTLSQYGVATAMKVLSNTWIISGTNLS